MGSSRLLIRVSNLLTSLTGGLLLSAAVGSLFKNSYLHEHGRLAAMVAGSAIGFPITNWVSAKWPKFRRKANLPLLAVVTDILILVMVPLVAKNQGAQFTVFALLCLRWALWATSRTFRAAAAKNLELPIHTVEGAAFFGLAIGAAVTAAGHLLTGGGWKGPTPTDVLGADICLFLIASTIDHAVAGPIDRATVAAGTGTTARDSYPLARVIALLVSLTLTTQMVLFAYNGAIAKFKAVQVGEPGWELLVPAVYLGATVACLFGGMSGAILLLPGSPNSNVHRPSLRLFGRVDVPVAWLCLIGTVCTLGAIWLSPRGLYPAALTAAALAANTILFTSALQSARTNCGQVRFAKAMAAYLPMAVLGLAVLSLSVTYAMSSMPATRQFLTAVGVLGFMSALECSAGIREQVLALPHPNSSDGSLLVTNHQQETSVDTGGGFAKESRENLVQGRAIFVCHENGEEYSPGIFVEYIGSESKPLDLLRQAAHRMWMRDAGTAAAQLCGFLHEQWSISKQVESSPSPTHVADGRVKAIALFPPPDGVTDGLVDWEEYGGAVSVIVVNMLGARAECFLGSLAGQVIQSLPFDDDDAPDLSP